MPTSPVVVSSWLAASVRTILKRVDVLEEELLLNRTYSALSASRKFCFNPDAVEFVPQTVDVVPQMQSMASIATNAADMKEATKVRGKEAADFSSAEARLAQTMPIIQKVQKTVEVPQIQYMDEIVDAPVQRQRQVPMIQMVQKTVEVPQIQHINKVAKQNASSAIGIECETVQLVQKAVEVPQTQHIDKVAKRNASSAIGIIECESVQKVQKIVEVPQMQYIDKLAKQNASTERLLQRSMRKEVRFNAAPQIQYIDNALVPVPQVVEEFVDKAVSQNASSATGFGCESARKVQKTVEVPQNQNVSSAIGIIEYESPQKVQKTVEVPRIQYQNIDKALVQNLQSSDDDKVAAEEEKSTAEGDWSQPSNLFQKVVDDPLDEPRIQRETCTLPAPTLENHQTAADAQFAMLFNYLMREPGETIAPAPVAYATPATHAAPVTYAAQAPVDDDPEAAVNAIADVYRQAVRHHFGYGDGDYSDHDDYSDDGLGEIQEMYESSLCDSGG